MSIRLAVCILGVVLLASCERPQGMLASSAPLADQAALRSSVSAQVIAGEMLVVELLSAPLPARSGARFECLDGCPAGMTVQAETGRVEWQTRQEDLGYDKISTLVYQLGKRREQIPVHVVVVPGPLASPTPDEGTALHSPVWEDVVLPHLVEGEAFAMRLLAHDDDGDTLTYACQAGCPTGLAVNAESGLVSWTPGWQDGGEHPVVFSVSDGRSETLLSKTLIVDNRDRPPTLSAPATVSGVEGVALNVPFSAADPDGDAVTVSCVRCPPGVALLTQPLRLSWTPHFGDAGTFDLTLVATAEGQATLLSSQWTIANGAHPPVLSLTLPGGGAQMVSPTHHFLVQGACSQRPVLLSSSGIPGVALTNRCDAAGAWSAEVTLAGLSGTLRITATDVMDSSDTAFVDVGLTVDLTPPQLQIVSPNAPLGVFTDAASLAISGTCSTDVIRLEATVGVTLSDSDCSDGTWAVLYPVTWTSASLSFTAFDVAGNSASKSLSVTRQIVLGQPDAETILSVNASSIPFQLWADGTRLAMSDGASHRVLIWNNHPTTAHQPPDVVLGQENASGFLANRGESVSARGLSSPSGVHWDGSRFYVAERGNNRVLIWDHFPTTNGEPASAVLGQTSLEGAVANAGGLSARTLSSPHGLWWVAGSGPRPPLLFVVDRTNQRVLAYNTTSWTHGPRGNLPPSSGPAADFVLGQPDMESNGVNLGGIGPTRVNSPVDVWSDGVRLVVSDYSNHRLLFWDAIPTASAPADRVLGQADLVSNSYTSLDSKGLSHALSAVACGGKFFVSQAYFRRIMVWNSVPGEGGFPQGLADAHLVLGPADMNSVAEGTTGAIFPSHGLACGGGKIFAADARNGLVIWWDAASVTSNGQAPAGYWSGLPAGRLPTQLNSYSSLPLTAPQQMVRVGTKFILADTGNHRVLIWNNPPSWSGEQPDVVLGNQTMLGFHANPTGSATAYSLFSPVSVASDGTNLMVSDSGNNRVLVWNSIPAASGVPADFALGQASLTGALANRGGAVAADTLKTPMGVHIGHGKVFVADSGNNRVLIWDAIPTNPVTDMGKAAQWALGQAGATIGTCNRGTTANALANTLCTPNKAVTNPAGKLLVVDTGNNRAVIFNSIPASHGPSADLVLGQASMTVRAANEGASVSAASLSSPADAWMDDTRVAIADTLNHRLLLWNVFPAADRTPASGVLGQASFGLATAAANGLYGPKGVFFDGSQLWVASTSDRLIRSWNSFPSRINASFDNGFPSAEVALPPHDDGKAFRPVEMAFANSRLYVSDSAFHRLLYWTGIPSTTDAVPDGVWGQTGLLQTSPNRGSVKVPSDLSLFVPQGISAMGNQGLLVADSRNSRVLGFTTAPSQPSDTPAWVLGQMDFTGMAANWEGPSRRTLSNPFAVASDGIRVAVADYGNNRVLLWNSLPLASGAPADVILGQPDSASNAPNAGGAISSSTLWAPAHVALVDGRLFVADSYNRRVLVWNTLPTTDFQPADLVLGQPDMFRGDLNAWGTVDSRGMYSPRHVMVRDGRVLVSDSMNSRVMVWRSLPQVNGQPADEVIGQPDFSSALRYGANSFGYAGFSAAHIFEQRLFLVDWRNYRILVRPFVGGGP